MRRVVSAPLCMCIEHGDIRELPMVVMGLALRVLFRHAPWMGMSLPFTFVLMLLSFDGAWFSTASLSTRRATIVMGVALAGMVAISLTGRKWRGRMRDLCVVCIAVRAVETA